MSKTLVGMVTFGNIPFSVMALNSVLATTSKELDFFVVVGQPNDIHTVKFLVDNDIPHVVHDKNYGFPYSVNDIYDYAWVKNDYDNLILMGNDIICYPYAIDSMIDLADSSDYKVISALQYDVKDLVREFPETRKYFSGSKYVVTDLKSQCWDKFKGYSPEPNIAEMQLYDIQNLCLYKKEVFEKVGYTDVNFYPAYYIDNDYARRIVNSGMRTCSLVNARFFHFWSRTINQGVAEHNHEYFRNNRSYYIGKWGGDFGKEIIKANVLIDTRENELEHINRWVDLDKK